MRLGDLDALKENVKVLPTIGDYAKGEIIEVIDNEPTVDPFEPDYVGAERLKARQRGYEEGYHNGMKIGKTLNPKTNQGEWILKEEDCDDGGNNRYECSKCHYADVHSDSVEVPFCWHCGSRMKGKEE